MEALEELGVDRTLDLGAGHALAPTLPALRFLEFRTIPPTPFVVPTVFASGFRRHELIAEEWRDPNELIFSAQFCA